MLFYFCHVFTFLTFFNFYLNVFYIYDSSTRPSCVCNATSVTHSVARVVGDHGRLHIGANGVSWPPWKNGWKIKNAKTYKKSSFLCLCYILRAIRAGRCRERRYADHIFIQIYSTMHHFVVKFKKTISPQAARGHCPWPPNQNPADVPVGDRGDL